MPPGVARPLHHDTATKACSRPCPEVGQPQIDGNCRAADRNTPGDRRAQALARERVADGLPASVLRP
jgi:hypothetical protein